MAEERYTAFAGDRLLASGTSAEVALAVKAAEATGASHVLIFDDATGEQVEVDPFAEPSAIAGRPPAEPPRPGRGRPKLGVVAREVTLLPRHWDWLSSQPSGASAALRRLIEEASRKHSDEARRARDAAYRVMAALAGDLPSYEEAARALFANRIDEFNAIVSNWPRDIGDHLRRLIGSKTLANP